MSRRDPYEAFGCVGNGSTTKTGKALAAAFERLLSAARVYPLKLEADSDAELNAMSELIAAGVAFASAERAHIKAMREYDRAVSPVRAAAAVFRKKRP
jgi:hypothetical protein